MSRPRRSAPLVLTRHVLVRVTEEEHARLGDAARDRACSVSHLVRCAIFRLQIPAPIPARVDRDAVVQLQKIGVNLNQVTRLLYHRAENAEDLRLMEVAHAVRAVIDTVNDLRSRLG